MKLSTQPYKGTRDFYPEQMRVRKWMFDKWREVCESFGYEEYDTPILEPLELYASKTSDEIVNEQTYGFTDRGGRNVVMRPEMTPSVSRIVAAKRQELAYPLRIYSIPNCFRYERPQRGRLREFWQLNADIFGVEGIEADIEIIQLADAIMKSFGATKGSYEIRVNSKVLLNKRIENAGGKEPAKILRIIDQKDKLSDEDFLTKLADLVDDPAEFKRTIEQDGDTKELKQLIQVCEQSGIDIVSSPTLARGFDYYTDIVFEVFDKNPDNNRSMFGGGRYDGLVGSFGVEPVETVGFGMGDATFMNFLESNDLIPASVGVSETDLYIIVIGDYQRQAQELAQKLREQGKKVAVDLTGRKPDKQAKTAEKKGIKQVIYYGEKEAKSGKYQIKTLNKN